MPLVAASKKLIRFEPTTFLSTINGGGRKILAFSKSRRSSLRVTRPTLFFMYRTEK
jgi:hypothetical protein